MPRENRKRGKKHKKLQPETIPQKAGRGQEDQNPSKGSGEPSWIVPAHEIVDPGAPFGYVDPDVKAYFRTIDEQIQAWQEDGTLSEDGDGDLAPNEAKRVFLVAALGEMSGQEKQLATDPNCSVTLERMMYSVDDFVLRVLTDRLSGSFEVLFRHRFASHVCQTLFSVATDTIYREAKGILPDVSASKENGELRTLTQLVLDVCEEVGPSFNSLIMDPFASHVLRSLLLLLCPNILPADAAGKFVRSKKSMSWKAKQGQMKSVFSEEKGTVTHSLNGSVPSTFRDAANEFLQILRRGLDANEIRALATHKVASPVLQLVLEIEADNGSAASPDSLMDRVLVGMIRTYYDNPTASIQPSDYFVTLLRDPTSSHLAEVLVLRCPEEVFNLLWSTYFEGHLVRLALHPVANFVLIKAIERHDDKQLASTLGELHESWIKLTRSSRTGVLRALIDRSRCLQTHQKNVCEAALASVEICNPDDNINLVPCMLLLKSLEEYRAISAPSEAQRKKRHVSDEAVDDQGEPKIQGAVLLQSLLKLDEPYCSIVVDSISSLAVGELIRIAQNAISSRVLDALLKSPTVSFRAKRRFIMSLVGHYHSLVGDRIGSRVVEHCWAFADPYLKEKIARSLLPFEQKLAASFYGKFVARNLNLPLLRRRPDEWRTLQSSSKTNSTRTNQQSSRPHPTSSVASAAIQSSRTRDPAEDEIDAVFKASLGNKVRKASVGRVAMHAGPSSDGQMMEVLGAIREAPNGESQGRKKRKKVA